jgi:hypothetical protein
MATQTPAVPKKSPDDLQLRFHWLYPQHRFLRTLTISVVARDGPGAPRPLPPAAGSTLGSHLYDIPAGVANVQLTIDVRSPLVALLHLEQRLQVVRSPGHPPTLVHTGSNVGSSFGHPRMEPMASVPSPGGGTLIDLPIDLRFLDVTEHVRRLPTKATPAADEAIGRFRHADDLYRHHGVQSRVRVLEHTGGRPAAWPVILPPALAAKVDQGVFLCLKNEALDKVNGEGVVIDGSYTTPDDANYLHALFPYWSSPSAVGRYVYSDGGAATYHDYPQFGWDQQLRNSGRSVIVLFPIPHAVDFGVLDRPSPATRRLLQSALICLYAEGHVTTGGSSAPFLHHLAVGGWSSGTDTLFRWVRPATPAGAGLVEEFWIFDGKHGFRADVRAWFNGNPSRRLRLIGSAYTETASNGFVTLASSNPNVSVYPGDPKYWYRHADYASSLASPGTLPFRFRSSPTAASLGSRDASTRSNIYLRSEHLVDNGISVNQSIVLFSPHLGQQAIGFTSHEEAAAFVIYEALDKFTGGGPVSTAAQFRAVATWVDQQAGASEPKHSFRHRHPWSVFGGLFNHNGRAFVGYLQLCLEQSGL